MASLLHKRQGRYITRTSLSDTYYKASYKNSDLYTIMVFLSSTEDLMFDREMYLQWQLVQRFHRDLIPAETPVEVTIMFDRVVDLEPVKRSYSSATSIKILRSEVFGLLKTKLGNVITDNMVSLYGTSVKLTNLRNIKDCLWPQGTVDVIIDWEA